MMEVVRKQAILVGLGMGAGIASMTLGSLAAAAFPVSGLWVALTAFGLLLLLLFTKRPDLLR